MGGIGGKGKGARRRQKLKDNAKVFDKKTGSFREAKIELIDGQVTREELLKAPSSFRRFMEATRRAREQQDRRDKRDRIARGEEDEGEDDDGDGAVDATGAGVAFAALLAYCAFQVRISSHPRSFNAQAVNRSNFRSFRSTID